MKYPSVLLTIVSIWLVVDLLAITLNRTVLTFNLYLATVIFSVILFFVGFWRNK